MKYITSCFIWLFVIKIKFKIIENQFDLLKFIENNPLSYELFAPYFFDA